MRKLEVVAFPEAAVKALAEQVARTTAWQITIDGGVLMVTGEAGCVSVEPDTWREFAA